LTRSGHGITNLFSDWLADLVGDSRTLLFSHLLGLNPGHHGTDTETSRTAVLDWDLGTLLPVEHLTVHLGHLATLQLRGISAFLSGEGATLTGGGLGTLGGGYVLAFFLLDSLALPFLNIGTFFLGHLATLLLGNILALLGGNLPALLGVVNLLTDGLVDGAALVGVDGVALLGQDCVTLPLGDILAFLFRDSGAFPLIDHGTLLLRYVLTDLILDSVTLSLVDNLTLGHGAGGADLLLHGLALGLVPGGAGLGSLRGTGFIMMCFLDGPWNIDTLQVLGVVALLLLLDGTLGADIIDRGTVLLDLNRTFSSLDLFLNLLLDDLTGFVLDIRTGLVRN